MEMAACDARRGQSTLPFDFWGLRHGPMAALEQRYINFTIA
jgi:hypothetical protein